MPYSKWSEVNPALKGIEPKVSLAQANEIADWADAMEQAEDGPDNPWAVAISQFRKLYRVEGEKWVKRKIEERKLGEVAQVAASAIEVAKAVVADSGEISRADAFRLLDALGDDLGAAISEAATIKSKAQRLMRDIVDILKDRELPQSLRKEIEDVRRELRRTWSDLATDAQGRFGMGEQSLSEAVMKTVDGKPRPAGDFLVVGDPEEVSTWHLPVKVNGKPDRKLAGGAWAALFSPGGFRGRKYAGPDKAGAQRKLRALYKAQEWEEPVSEADASEMYYEEPSLTGMALTFADLLAAEEAQEAMAEVHRLASQFQMLVNNVMFSESTDDKPAAIRALADEFADLVDQKTEVAVAEQAAVSGNGLIELSEDASGHVVGLAEGIAAGSDVVPFYLNTVIIEPGFGNKKRNHYYSAEMLKRDAGVFTGVKMFETDHKPGQKSTRTWVSTMGEIVGFTDKGAPIGRVTIHNEDFGKRVLALNEAKPSLLHKLECSILGEGKVREGEVDGKEANIVDTITSASAVDWVTRGGAGGHAQSLAESETLVESETESGGENVSEETQVAEEVVEQAEIQAEAEVQAENVTETVALAEANTEPENVEPELTLLTESQIDAVLAEATLPGEAKVKLAFGNYETEDALKAAIQEAADRITKLTGAGQPVAVEAQRQTPGGEPMSEAEYVAAYSKIMDRHGIYVQETQLD